MLVSALSLAGCVSPDLAEWGEDGIEVTYDSSAKTATLSTQLGDNSIDNAVVNLAGCDSEGNIEKEYNSKPVLIEGWLTRTNHFPNGIDMISNAEKMSVSAVIIQLNAYDDAESPEERLLGVKWVNPTEGVKAIPPGESSSSNFPHSGWAVVGLIPANEEILKGFGALDAHQKISLKGWFLSDSNYPPNTPEVTGNCRIDGAESRGGGFSGSMLVTQITLGEHGVISESEPYDAFSVSPIGSAAYILLILFSFGGAVILFLLSTGMIRRGAKMTAKELLTEAQLLAARGVKKDISRVLKDIESETGRGLDVKAAKADVVKAEKLSTKPEVELDDFDIDSVLRASNRPDARSVRGVESGGVVTTDESISMDEQIAEKEADIEEEARWVQGGRRSRRGGRGGGGGGEQTPPDSAQTDSMTMEKGEAAKPKVRKTRSAKKKPEPEPEPEPEPVKRGSDVTDDEDFSDFSL
jgi:hypothetical protein